MLTYLFSPQWYKEEAVLAQAVHFPLPTVHPDPSKTKVLVSVAHESYPMPAEIVAADAPQNSSAAPASVLIIICQSVLVQCLPRAGPDVEVLLGVLQELITRWTASQGVTAAVTADTIEDLVPLLQQANIVTRWNETNKKMLAAL